MSKRELLQRLAHTQRLAERTGQALEEYRRRCGKEGGGRQRYFICTLLREKRKIRRAIVDYHYQLYYWRDKTKVAITWYVERLWTTTTNLLLMRQDKGRNYVIRRAIVHYHYQLYYWPDKTKVAITWYVERLWTTTTNSITDETRQRSHYVIRRAIVDYHYQLFYYWRDKTKVTITWYVELLWTTTTNSITEETRKRS
jgi:predicted transcriptional regulator